MNRQTIFATRTRESLGSRLDAHRGIGPGFDHLRIGLSLSILVWHAFGISYGLPFTRENPVVVQLRPLISTLLPMFFALSGFLVMGSALRINDLRTFITFRTLRILPALATEISLSALVLGPILTTYSLSDYFSDGRFIAYFGSLVGRVQYLLPGLFLGNPLPEVVNGALWTVGPEIFCYVGMSLLILTASYRHRGALLAITALYIALCVASDILFPPVIMEVLPTKALVLGFLAGGIIYHYRYDLPFSLPLAAAAAIGAILSLALVQRGGPLIAFMYVAVILIAYVIAFVGLCALPPLPFFHRGDYSYGIYIFGFPIQQTVAHFLPDLRLWWINLAIALPITLVFAVASWHLIEKPVLAFRKPLLRSRTARHPQPPHLWSRRSWLIAAALILYGFFVALGSDVFPLRHVIAHVLRSAPAPARPPII